MKGVAAFLLLLLVAGCMEPDAAPAPADPVPTGPPDALAARPIADGDPAPEPGGPRMYRLAENLTYADQVRRYVLTAEGNVTVALDVDATPLSVDRPSNCLAVAADLRIPDVDEPVMGLYFVAWAGDASLATEATILGQRVEVLPDPLQGSAGLPGAHVDGEADATMAAGDRLTIQLGGARPQPEAGLQVDLLVFGEARLEELPPAPVACGRGIRDAQGSQAGLATYIVTSSVGGELAFQSVNASTMLAGRTGAHPGSEVHYQFLQEEPQPLVEDVVLSSPVPGRMALLIGRDVDSAGSTAWFFADTLWPLEPGS